MIIRDDEFKRILPIHSSLRVYPVVYDTGEKEKFLNIFRTFIKDSAMNDSYSLFVEYVVNEEDWFDLISYRYYGTPYLWWLIAVMNDITNPFESLDAGASIRVLRSEYLYLAYDALYQIERL